MRETAPYGRVGRDRTEGKGLSRVMMRQYELVERVKRYNPAANEALLTRAYVYAMRAHGTQKRASRRRRHG